MPHPDSTATLIDSYDVAVLLETEAFSLQQKKTCQVIVSVAIYRTTTDQIDYVLIAASTSFDQGGDPEAVDDSSASQIFELASIAAVDEGVVRSHTSSPPCISPAQATVYVEGCISRSSSGLATVISPCSGTAMGNRVLSVCTSASVSQVTVSSRSQPTCSGGCEPTCNQP
jgi:hypothetical protein